MPNNTRTTRTRWIRTVAAVVTALLGAGIVVADVAEVVQGAGRISELRAHGRRVPGEAFVEQSCSTGRGGGCSASGVSLSFHDAHGLEQFTEEPRLAQALYVPSGPVEADGSVRTTVVYDPADPQDAQAAGVLHWGALDLLRHRMLPLTIGLVLAVVGPAALAVDGGRPALPRAGHGSNGARVTRRTA
ncbi:hypothetical protein RKE30_37250 [Streptomyces sp. Li-HN-5-11]|uniref:DUF3592 domain-containing protein n=1 Tax=Streptomyces sp. Li-HN-5-11 TaxID=3075432 RepID=UPI0028A67330|nr:DUF3592 domain-containing protein [Streptomyces sp. Li-HN-5-11]WNM35606.1 hypothetical protein RKE30_37250 [Streptomyces sp. Li-HN-5-11]